MLPGASLAFAVLLASISPNVDTNSYEWKRTKAVLTAEKLAVEREPEGKRIAWIRVVRDEVFVAGEVFPTWFNIFHARTRERIVTRELLFAVGDGYEHEHIEESMRNLRGMSIFALARIVAVRSNTPGEVGVLVHTRDLWSLRLESAFNVSTQLNGLDLGLVERNVAGIGHHAGIGFSLRPDTFSMSETYSVRRVLGGPLRLYERGGLIFNRDSATPEGGFGSFVFGRPFYSIAQTYSYGIEAAYTTRIRRQLSNGEPLPWIPDGSSQAAGSRIWSQRNLDTSASFAIRRGHKARHTVRAFAFFDSSHYGPNSETDIDDGMHASFADQVLPPDRREVGPGLSYSMFIPNYRTYTDLDTFGQSENVRLGPDVDASIRAPLTIVGSYKEARIASVSLGWTWPLGGGLISASGGARARWQDAEFIDQRISASMRGATPMMGFVRLVARARTVLRWNDTSKSLVSLGSDDGLRGFPAEYLTGYGAHMINTNVELRTKGVAWRGVIVGGVLFYDTGAVFSSLDEMHFAHGFGAGLRLLLPQLNRTPWIADAGFSTESFVPVPTIRSGLVMNVD